MKKKWVKPEIKFITDPDIILGCLYEVYGQEQKSVLAVEYPAYDDLPFSPDAGK